MVHLKKGMFNCILYHNLEETPPPPLFASSQKHAIIENEKMTRAT